ncbi:hypothetical protein Tco_1297494 [Tanacetum coccineum]
MLKVSPRKGVKRFGKQGKINPQYIEPFKILKRVGPVAYTLDRPKELSNIHITFYVSNLKKCLFDESLVIPIKELRLDDKLKFVEEPIEIMDPEVKKMKRSRILIVKVRWNSKRGPEFTLHRKKVTHFEAPVVSPNGDSIPVKGKGDYILPGETKVNEVLYVLDFKCNLLLVSRLSRDLQCCISFFLNFQCCISFFLNLIGVGRCEGGLYRMKMVQERRAMATTAET